MNENNKSRKRQIDTTGPGPYSILIFRVAIPKMEVIYEQSSSEEF